MAIGIRNAASEQAHTDCEVTVLDIDIPYAKDENNLARTAAYKWSNYIVQKLKEQLTGGRTIVVLATRLGQLTIEGQATLT